MLASELSLIQRLKERNSDRQRATDDSRWHPTKSIPPVAAKNLQSAEFVLGFRLPAFLRAIYLMVGNGGFGPSYGIVGTRGGFKHEKQTLESCYRSMPRLQKENSIWHWPKRLLPLGYYGCGMWSCVDCEYKKLPMITWDPNNLDAELNGADARRNWGNSFWDQGESLKTWLEGWRTDKPEPEPKWPAWTWMRRDSKR